METGQGAARPGKGESMFHTSRIELSASALRSNLRFIRRQVGSHPVVNLVVKANAYGHGIETFLPLAESCGLRHFAVFSAQEAFLIRSLCHADSCVTIMGDVEGEGLAWAIREGVPFHVFQVERLHAALELARRIGRPARLHLEFETGMNRLGLEEESLEELARALREAREDCLVEGTCTHLAGAENIANYVRIVSQLETFHRVCNGLAEFRVCPGLRHVSSSAGIFCYPEAILDQVRVGICAYGFWPTQEVRMRYVAHNAGGGRRPGADPLRRVLSWKSRVMSVKQVAAGDFVGYGTSYLATRAKRAAVVPVGYRDGYARTLSNRGRVLVRGRRCPVIGMVNMNMITVDVTGIADVHPGEEVVLIGRQNRNQISVASFSDLADDMNYEVLTRLSPEIPRLAVK